MIKKLLEVESLSVRYKGNKEPKAINNISFSLGKGESLGVIGESGCGKTTLAKTLMSMEKELMGHEGHIYFDGKDLFSLNNRELNTGIRWNRISLVFQNNLNVLNPLLTLKEQIAETLSTHKKYASKEIDLKINELLDLVYLDPEAAHLYPHQISGGMRQKFLVAMALSCDPELLILDEPTSSLDAHSKKILLALLKKLQREKKTSLLVISHDLPFLQALTDKLMVLMNGMCMEYGSSDAVFNTPLHPFSRDLIKSSPEYLPFRDLWGIPSDENGPGRTGNFCPYVSRCTQRIERCFKEQPRLSQISSNQSTACLRQGIITFLEAQGISKHFKHKKRKITVCDGCELEIKSGEVVALMGESGTGKSTLAMILAGIIPGDKGRVSFMGRRVQGNSETSRPEGIQIVFQDPYSSIDEKMTVISAVCEPLEACKKYTASMCRKKACRALKETGLSDDEEFLSRRCYTLSGGQRQRIALARSLVMDPALLIADEITSSLDPPLRADCLRMLKGLQYRRGFSMLFVTHNIFLAKKIADKILVMKEGKISELPPDYDFLDKREESKKHKPIDLHARVTRCV